MEEIENCLKVITNPADAGPGDLLGALQKLDQVVKQSQDDIHPRLRHFLENRSYQKALVWLEGDTPEKGVCGG